VKTLSAARLKGKCPAGQDRPRPGTLTRRMYDLLVANKGIPLDVPLTMFEGTRARGQAAAIIEALRNIYGLDIRKLGVRRWVLAGEWFGKVYVDYIAEKIE